MFWPGSFIQRNSETLFGVEIEVWIKRHAGRQRHLVDQDRIAVGIAARRLVGGDHAAGAADVLDHDRLAERFLHRVLDDARDGVGGAAGRERHQQRDGVIGIGLCGGGAGYENKCSENRCRERASKKHGDS
jgi:hypothetical protein